MHRFGEFADLIEFAQNGGDDWTSNIPDGWDFMGVPNGGLVSSIMATALVAATERPDPITSTAHFPRPARPGPVVIETEIIRKGRALTTALAALTQGDTLMAHMVASLGDLVDTGEAIVDIDLPQLPTPDKCVGERGAKPFEFPAIAQRIKTPLHPDQVGFATGHPSDDAVVSGWVDIPTAARSGGHCNPFDVSRSVSMWRCVLCRMSELDKYEVWDRFEEGESQRSISRRLGRSTSTIRTLLASSAFQLSGG